MLGALQVSRGWGLSAAAPEADPRLSLAGLPARGLEPAPGGGREQAAAGSAAAAAAEARFRGEGRPFPSARAPRSLASAEGKVRRGPRVPALRAQACAGTRRRGGDGLGTLDSWDLASSGMGCVATQTVGGLAGCVVHAFSMGPLGVGAHALQLGA